MNDHNMPAPAKWAAEVSHVREVSLWGTADLNFWKDRLQQQDLLPAVRDAQAQILITAADIVYMGVRFRELSVSALVARPDAKPGQGAAYLLRAFNSFRFFAFIERNVFSTPYYYGDVRVSATIPASMHLMKRGEFLFRAEMKADAAQRRPPTASGDEGWEGPIYLPEPRRGPGRPGKWFFARLRGQRDTYPFLPASDVLEIRPSPDSEVLQALQASRFVAQEWLLCEDATHAKSKTFTRGASAPRPGSSAIFATPPELSTS